MYPKRTKNWTKHWDFILLDLIALAIAFFFGYRLRMGTFFLARDGIYRNLFFIYLAVDLLVILVGNMYRKVIRRGYLVELVYTAGQILLVTSFVAAWFFASQIGKIFSRLMVTYTFFFYLALSYTLRILLKSYLRKHGQKGRKENALVVVTVRDLASEVIWNVSGPDYNAFQIRGLILMDEAGKGGEIEGIPVLAGQEDYLDFLTTAWVDEVLVAFPDRDPIPGDLVNQFLEAGLTVHVRLYNSQTRHRSVHSVDEIGNYTVMTSAIQSVAVWQMAVKRIFDIIISLIGCLVTGILYLVLAPRIRKADPGPVFFRQERIGRNGRHFMMYKFRSMVMDADRQKKGLARDNKIRSGLMFKLDEDPRIIGSKILSDGTYVKGIGNTIRDLSLDEFPQFLNVLRGDMSVIGTRPPTVDEWDHYKLHHRARMAIKPGITGMWQVSGRSKITDFEEVVRLDMDYIEHWNFRLDLKIFFQTIAKVLKKEGAE